MYIRIFDELYDVGDWKHPGGSVIRSHAWTPDNPVDATNAFLAFHQRNIQTVHNILKQFPRVHRGTLVPRDPIEKDFTNLRNKLVREGWFEPSWTHVAWRIVSNACLWMFGMYMMSLTSRLGLFLGVIVCSVAYKQVGWIQHEGGHSSLTGNPRVDRCIQAFYYNIVLAGHFQKWNHQHFSHHASTQHVNHDVDLKTLPLVAFHKKVVDRKPVSNIFLRNQGFLYWTLINPLVWFIWGFFSYPYFAWRKGNFLSYAASHVLSYVCHLGTLCAACGMPLFQAVWVMHLYSMLGTSLLLATFTVSHTTTDVRTDDVGWVRPAALHTINQPDTAFTTWWMGYLNFQIEHHLFPTMPQFRQAKLAREYIRPFFKKHNLPYRVVGLVESLKAVHHNLVNVSEYVRTKK
mgnify:CR=1 FL=1